MPPWVLHFDGLYEPRQIARGIATYGYQIHHGDAVVAEGKGLLVGQGEGGSANVAEFGALVHGLDRVKAVKRDDCPLVVRGDSRLAIETTAGRWNLSSLHLVPLRDVARAILTEIGGKVALEKVSREANAEADRLSREAYHEAADAHPEWGLGIHSKTHKARHRAPGTPKRL